MNKKKDELYEYKHVFIILLEKIFLKHKTYLLSWLFLIMFFLYLHKQINLQNPPFFPIRYIWWFLNYISWNDTAFSNHSNDSCSSMMCVSIVWMWISDGSVWERWSVLILKAACVLSYPSNECTTLSSV